MFEASLQSNYACLTANDPVKQSPAPTVSMILYSLKTYAFDEAGHLTCKSLEIKLEPFDPYFNNTFKLGYFEISLFLHSFTISSKLILGSSLAS